MFLYQRSLTVEEHAAIYVGAVFVVLRLLGAHFDQLRGQMGPATHLGFALLVAGLMSLRKYQTLRGIAQALGLRSHDTLRNALLSTAWKPAVIVAALVQFVLQQGSGLPGRWGVLILDDVIIPKRYAKKLPFVHWDYDYVTDRPIRCMRVVMLVWTNGLIKIPVGFKLWHKQGSAYLREHGMAYQTKHQLARQLVIDTLAAQVPFDYLTFDSWYASKDNIQWLCEQEIRFVTVLPCNAKVRLLERPLTAPRHSGRPREWYRCEQLETVYPPHDTCHRYPDLQARAKQLPVRYSAAPDRLSLVPVWHFRDVPELAEQAAQEAKKPRKKQHPHLYILTNMPGLSVREIVAAYRRRWAIEVLFRDLKQHLGLGACVVRQPEAGERHLALCLLGYVGLEVLRQECHQDTRRALDTLTIGDVKTDLAQTVVLVTRNEPERLMIPARVEPLPKALSPVIQAALAEPVGTRISA